LQRIVSLLAVGLDPNTDPAQADAALMGGQLGLAIQAGRFHLFPAYGDALGIPITPPPPPRVIGPSIEEFFGASPFRINSITPGSGRAVDGNGSAIFGPGAKAAAFAVPPENQPQVAGLDNEAGVVRTDASAVKPNTTTLALNRAIDGRGADVVDTP